MKEAFIKDIKLDCELELSTTDRRSRSLEMKQKISEYIDSTNPDMMIVYGDTDTTLSAAQSASEKKIPLCHIEAGLRSHNLEMPEEINRIETDRLSQLLLCPSTGAVQQLKEEGIENGVFEVGDIMKDAILMSKGFIKSFRNFNYYYATIHRPYNVDIEERLRYLLETFNNLDELVLLPLHPRTEAKITKFGIDIKEFNNIQFLTPQGYISNLSFMSDSKAVLTDSGGMQKEAYWINKKCVTLRSETEWRETLINGCNTLMFDNLENLQTCLNEKAGPWDINLYGDGKATFRINEVIDKYLEKV